MQKTWQIPLASSPNFRRLVTVIYGFVLLILWQSQWTIFAKLVLVSMIGLQLLHIHKRATPYRRFVLLEYMGTAWQLHHRSGKRERFLEGRIVMSFGYFFLLKLQNGMQIKIFVVFVDQLSEQFYRFLRLNQQCKMNRWF